jgi:trans-2,3-dihydro-3-hydroxyanthranilate isomerase
MAELNYYVVDVFSERALAGNPLAVVFQTGAMRTEEMQAIAREFNLSETTFVERRDAAIEAAEGVRVRIFTTQEELNFAGHPTLGTASVLKLHAPETMRGGVITLAENVGPILVRFEDESSLYGEMTQNDPEFGKEFSGADEQAEIARLTGLHVDDFHPTLHPRIVSTGTAFAILPLRSADALSRMNVKHAEALEWLRTYGARWFYVLGPTGSAAPEWRARMQFNGSEDPATGSAAGCAISHLVNGGLVESGNKIHLRQGVEMGRPSEIFLSAQRIAGKVTHVRVAGSTTPVANGRLFLP